MIKRKIIETVEEYDASGKLTKRTITETQEDDGVVIPTYPIYPSYPWTPRDWEITWTKDINTTGHKPI